jgi:hypothetical protein
MFQPTSFQFAQTLYLVVKVFALIGFSLYVAFAFIATRQIHLMRKTVITPLSGFVALLGYAHFFLAIAALVFVYFYLAVF